MKKVSITVDEAPTKRNLEARTKGTSLHIRRVSLGRAERHCACRKEKFGLAEDRIDWRRDRVTVEFRY